MTTLIPRDQILEIMRRHGDFWGLIEDPPADVVRKTAKDLRTFTATDPEADELDALVDRIEAIR